MSTYLNTPSEAASTTSVPLILKLIESKCPKISDSEIVPPLVDESEIKPAANFLEFFETSPLWARPTVVALIAFNEICIKCTPNKYIHAYSIPKDADKNWLREKLTLTVHGVCPKCGDRRVQDRQPFDQIRDTDIDEVVVTSGKLSGTTTLLLSMMAYHLHRILASDAQDVMLPLVGITFSRAHALLWTPFREMLKTLPWYVNYFRVLDAEGRANGQDLYVLDESFLRISYTGVTVFPCPPNRKIFEDKPLAGVVADDLYLMISDYGRLARYGENSESPMTALELRYLCRQGVELAVDEFLLGQGLMLYPARGIPTSEFNGPSTLRVHARTWDWNPHMDFGNAWLQDHLEKDAVKFQQDFGADLLYRPEGTMTAKEAWWAGYRAGKGLPPDTPRKEALKATSGCSECGDTGMVFDVSGEGPWSCYCCNSDGKNNETESKQ